MKFDRKMLQLYAITDRHWVGDLSLLEQIEIVLKNGATCLQLREKHLSKEEFISEAKEVKKLCNKYNVPLIINDSVEVALAVGADGVHVGQDDLNCGLIREKVGEDMIVGVSSHNVEEALEAYKNGADYIGIGAAFSTSTKTDTSVMTAQTMKDITANSPIPAVAIGGITIENLPTLYNRGLAGVAVISSLFGAKNIKDATIELKTLTDILVNNG